MSNKVYDVLNKIQRWLPALGAFYVAIAAVWALPFSDAVNQTIAAIATLLAATLEIFSASFYKKQKTEEEIAEKANIDTFIKEDTNIEEDTK